MATRKSTAEYSIQVRKNHLESAVVAAEHLSKHPDLLRKKYHIGENRGSRDESDDDVSDDETFEFAEFLRALTSADSAGSAAGKEALQETFKILDCDGDGFITLADLREAMRDDSDQEDDDDCEMTDDDLVEMIAAADKKGDGKIDFDSFVRILEPRKPKSGKSKHKKESETRKSKSSSRK